jgi:general secretion pathway protein A
MYNSFYNVAENPFKICTDPRFLWCSEKHTQILSSLIYGLMDHNGVVVLTGKIGTGKTTLVNALLKILDTDVVVARINHPRLSADEFLTLVAKSLDPDFTATSKSDLLFFLDSFFSRVHAEGKIVLLIIDEAQQLSMELLEEIRLLSNKEQAGQRILSVMLVGQTELKSRIEAPQSRAFYQRVTLFSEIQALSEEETPLYVEYRLKVSGLREQLFTSQAVQMIHTFAQGNPRLINILCDRAMRIGFIKKHHKIDADIIIECARDLKLFNRLKVKVYELFGPEFPPWRDGLTIMLKRWVKSAGPRLQSAPTRLRDLARASVSQIRSKGGALARRLQAFQVRGFKEHRSKTSSVWVAAIGLVAALVTISMYVATHDEKRLEARDPQWSETVKATEEPTLLASTSPTAAQQWLGRQSHQTAETDPQTVLEPLNPAPQPIASEPEPSPLNLAASALKQKDYQKTLELLESSLGSEVRQNREATGLYSEALLGRALEIMDASPSEAEAMLFKAIDISPDNARAYLTLGKYRTRTKAYDLAVDAYRHAIRLDPDLSDAHYNLGYVYATTGNFQDAEAAFNDVVQLEPPYLGKSLFNLAVVQQKLGKKEQSLANLEKAVALMPQNEKVSAYLKRLKHSATESKEE